MGNSKQILLMRHAEVDAKWRGRFLGACDPPLSGRGLEQAAWWRRELSAITIDRIVSSNQKRALQTARTIAEEQGCAVEAIAAFREVDLGLWEGLPPSEVRRRYPHEYDLRGRDLAGFPPPQGESLSDLAARVLPAWRELGETEASRILLAAHAGVLRVILCDALGMDLSRALSWRLDHASLSVLRLHNRQVTLLAGNIVPQDESLAQRLEALSDRR